MKNLMVVLLVAFTLQACTESKADSVTPTVDTPIATPAPQPQPQPSVSPSPTPSPIAEGCCKLNIGKPKWYVGTVCPKDVPSKGSGRNNNGQIVVGCFEDAKVDCHCQP